MTYSTMALEQVFAEVGGHRIGQQDRQIHWLLIDSRSLSSPEDTLFFALISARNDGHRYVEQLYQRGVRCFVVTCLPQELHEDAVYYHVPDSRSALQHLASHHRLQFQIPVIGITGSNGKTTVKEWLAQMLAPDHVVTRSPRSYNSQVGVPLSVWNLAPQTEIGIFEAGISEPGEMRRLSVIVRPTIGILTGIGDAHQENFMSLEQKCMEKLQLFRTVDTLIYPKGNPVVDGCIAQFQFAGNLVPVEVESEDGLEVDRQLCAAACRVLGMEEETIQQRLSKLEGVAMRLEVKNGRNACTLINDSYNSDLSSLDIALDFMARRATPPQPSPTGEGEEKSRLPLISNKTNYKAPSHAGEGWGGVVLILSDIQQTGLEGEELYRRVADMARRRGVQTFIGVGPNLCANKEQFNASGMDRYFFPTTEALLVSRVFSELHHCVVLFKGARSFHFERLVEEMEERVHETILEVDTNALTDNLNHYRSLLQPQTRIACMVKAAAYGAGSVEVSRVLQDNGVDYLAVAVADEGVELREAGISTGIIIMNPEMTSFRTMFRHNLEPEVYSFRLLDALIAAAEREGLTGFPVHIKLDTGMHRLGFDPQRDMPQLISRLRGTRSILPRSIFSHFVGSDSDDFDQFSARQYQLFQLGADTLQQAYPDHHILRHICNSAAIEHFPGRQMDMVRLGLGLYGINPYTPPQPSPAGEGEFKSPLPRPSSNTNYSSPSPAGEGRGGVVPVSTLKTTILQIHDVPADETVGYSRKGVLYRDSRIATLPIGYADGLDRHLGNGHAYCLVNGQKAPYVGNICMDVCMIDVTDIPCQEGDTAIIFGRDLPVTILSDITSTIPYEILTSVSNRVKRVYYKE